MKNTEIEGSLMVPGKPVPQKRHRSTFKSGRIRNYDPSYKDKKRFKAIVYKLSPKMLPKGGINVSVTFYMSRPKSHHRTGKYSHLLKSNAPKVHVSKPDIDNLSKFIMDALQGILWEDDCHIVSLEARKEYSSNPRTEIEYWQIKERKNK